MKQCIFLSFVFAFISCGQSTTVSSSTDKKQEDKKTPSKDKVQMLKLIKHQVYDKQGTGMVASTYLLPEGWSVNDNLYWEYRDPTVPIRYKGLMQSADGSMIIQSYPDVRASWYTGPSGTQGYRPPSDILSGMKDLIKAERKGGILVM